MNFINGMLGGGSGGHGKPSQLHLVRTYMKII